MANHFNFGIPSVSGDSIEFSLSIGDVLYILGANGTGKSSLVSRLFNQHQIHAKRISAHRQTWFESNTLDMTPRARKNIDDQLRSQDADPRSRYWEWNAAGRASMAIYDLIDADTMQERGIARLVRDGDIPAARDAAKNPSPLQVINELMGLSNLPIEISLEEGQKIVAHKNGGVSYSVAELSDGERNAFLIASDVLTAKPGTLIIMDEPERHLHRSIISPLLKLLFDRRKDCAFIISTHEPMLPLDTPNASALLLRGCTYQGKTVQGWTADMLKSGVVIDDELKKDILGSRRKIVFVEGSEKSLDLPLYSLLFPRISIVPKEGCRDVEQAVRGLRGAGEVHWISAWGIIDNDQRDADDLARLKAAGIWALSHYSVESLYYHPKIIARVAQRQASIIGTDATELSQSALTTAIAAAADSRDHLVTSAVLRAARKEIIRNLPNRKEINRKETLSVEVDLASLRTAEQSRFDTFLSEADWDSLLTRYPLRESSAFDRVVDALKFRDRATYQAAVLKLVQDETTAVEELRSLLGDLYSNVMAQY